MYTDTQMLSLGHRPNPLNIYVILPEKDEIRDLVYGKFKNILEIIFSSEGTQLDDVFKVSISENAPESVRMFAQNMMAAVQALPAMPNDDIAFDTIVPRSVQTSSEFQPYLDYMRTQYDDVVARYKQSDVQPNPE